MKKSILFLILFLWFNSAFSAENEVWENDVKKLFLNNKAIIYELNIRTFNAKDLNGNEIIEINNKEESGNFINAIERLDELKYYGINTLNLMPITPVGKIKALGTAGSLYAMSDFNKINEQLNSQNNALTAFEEAKIFIKEAHKRGMNVIVELPSCGSYDLFLSYPSLFEMSEQKLPIVISDWADVRLFKSKNDDGTLNQDLLEAYKSFFNMLYDLNIDGVKASVAYIKPQSFWKEIISYMKQKDPKFLFIADVTPKSTKISKNCPFTSYTKLLDIGFDCYNGDYPNFKNLKSIKDFIKSIKKEEKIIKKYKKEKSTISTFYTHDDTSLMLKGKEELTSQIFWLNATLKSNPYFLDGMQTGDKFIYQYANKKAPISYTDDEFYYVHKGKTDIFNFSRRPDGINNDLKQDFINSINFRNLMSDVILKGTFNSLKTNNKMICAFERKFDKKRIIVYFNNSNTQENVKFNISPYSSKLILKPIKFLNEPKIQKTKIEANLRPFELQVLIII